MLVRDEEIIKSLSNASPNTDHRKAFVGHLFNKETKESVLRTFYAYYKKDALELAKEYCTRFTQGFRLVDLRLEK